MTITAFPAASVLVSGQSIIGKSTSGAGICAELTPSDVRTLISAQPLSAALTALAGVTTAANKLTYATGANTFATTDLTAFARTILDDADAATVLSTIGAQATLVSGTNLRTINGQSLLGSTDLTISGTAAGGSSTQIQFNSSSAFAGSANLTWDGTALNLYTPELAPDEGSGYVMRIRPPGDRNNKPFNIISGVSQNPNGSFNFGVNMGFNAAPGGGAEDPDVSGFWLAFEENWQTVIGETPSRLKEYHTCFSPSATTPAWGWTKNSHIRLVSWEINETTGQVTQFQSSGNFSIRIPQSTSNGLTWFSLQPGSMVISDATNAHALTIEPAGGYINYDGTHLHLFSQGIQTQSTLTALGVITTQSTADTALDVYGGIVADKTITSRTSVSIFSYQAGGKSEPDGVGGAMQLYGKTFSEIFTPHVRLGGDAALPLWYSRRTSSASTPTTTELPSTNMMCIHTNTSDSKVYLAFNDGGTIKKVELT